MKRCSRTKRRKL